MTTETKNRLLRARAKTAKKQKLLSLKKALVQLRTGTPNGHPELAGRVAG